MEEGEATDRHRLRNSAIRFGSPGPTNLITNGSGGRAGGQDAKGDWIVKTPKSWLVYALLVAVALPCSSLIAQDKISEGGGNGGGQDPPNDAFELYGDLYIVVRDVNGEVIRDANGCPRPIYAIGSDPAPPVDLPGGLECALVPLCGDDPLGLACLEEIESPTGEVEACDIWDPFQYLVDPDDPDVNPLFEHLQEIHFGRLAVARSPVDVIDHGYLEAIDRLNHVQQLEDENGDPLPNITTDPAGRIHYYALNAETGETGWFTIDAPLENLGIYDRIMKFGALLRVEYIRVDKDLMVIVEEAAPDWNKFVLSKDLASLDPCFDQEYCNPYDACDPYADADAIEYCDSILDPTRDDLLIAASAIAAAGDKTGFLTTDALIHVNTYLGINDLNSDPAVYFPYDLVLDDPYDRAAQYGENAPVPLLRMYPDISYCDPIVGQLDGYPCFYVAQVQAYEAAAFRDIPHCTSWNTDHFYLEAPIDGPTIYEIFGTDLESLGYDAEQLGQAQQIAQAAEDARAIIWHIHNWALPELTGP